MNSKKILNPFSDMKGSFVKLDLENKRAETRVKQERHLPYIQNVSGYQKLQ